MHMLPYMLYVTCGVDHHTGKSKTLHKTVLQWHDVSIPSSATAGMPVSSQVSKGKLLAVFGLLHAGSWQCYTPDARETPEARQK